MTLDLGKETITYVARSSRLLVSFLFVCLRVSQG